MRVVGFLIVAVLILGMIAISPGTSLEAFVDVPSAIVVFGGTAALLLVSHDPSSWRLCARFILGQSAQFDDQERGALSHFFATGGRAALAWGFFGQLTGLIIMLGNMDDPAAIGPGVAVSMLTLFYGIALSEFFFHPLQDMVARKLSFDPRRLFSRTGLYLVFAVEALLIAKMILLAVSCVEPNPQYQRIAEELRNSLGSL